MLKSPQPFKLNPRKNKSTPRRNKLRLEELESRLVLTATLNVNYTSPYTISGLTLSQAQQNKIGTVTGSGLNGTLIATGLIGQTEVDTTPTYSNIPATNGWYNPNNSWYSTTNGPNLGNQEYGPQPNVQPTPHGVATTFADTQTYIQDLLYTEEQLINVPYQHHHDPLFDPFTNGYQVNPNNPTASAGNGYWPWLPVSTSNPLGHPIARNESGAWQFVSSNYPDPYALTYGTGSQGIDCSDLTTLAYNVAAGIHLDSGVGVQGLVNPALNNGNGGYVGTHPIYWNTSGSVITTPDSPANGTATDITPQYFFPKNSQGAPSNLVYDSLNPNGPINYIKQYNTPGSLDGVLSQLQPGDLLYIVASAGSGSYVAHVVTWLGKYGTMANGDSSPVPLVLSSHDDTPAVLDSNNLLAPPGVEILPFDPNSWFYQNFAYAMRVLPSMPSVTLSSVMASPSQASPSTMVTLTANFGVINGSGTPTGNVTFVAMPRTLQPQVIEGTPIFLGSAPLSNGLTAQIQTTALTGGNYVITASYSGDTNFGGNIGSQPLALTASPNQLYVDQLYELLLHRAADNGSSGWVAMLNSGKPATTVVQGIENSPEYRADLVISFYALYLNRKPDPVGFSGWTSRLAAGASVEEVEAGIVGSAEFFAMEGGNNTAFVTALYQILLQRAPTISPPPPETASWVQQMTSGKTAATVALAFLTSSEYRTLLVNSYYLVYLGRPADSTGLASWLAALQAGQTDQAVLAGILGSAEGYKKWS